MELRPGCDEDRCALAEILRDGSERGLRAALSRTRVNGFIDAFEQHRHEPRHQSRVHPTLDS